VVEYKKQVPVKFRPQYYGVLFAISDIYQRVFQKKHLLKIELKNECFNGRNLVLPPFRSVVEAFKRVNKSFYLINFQIFNAGKDFYTCCQSQYALTASKCLLQGGEKTRLHPVSMYF